MDRYNGKYHNTLPYGEYKSFERAAYQAEQGRLHTLFYDDMANEYGYTDNPKREKLESLAWLYGHSSGYGEVENYISELVDLIL